MCHSHTPGWGIDLLRLNPIKAELTVRLAADDCHYVLTAAQLRRVMEDNPWRERPGPEPGDELIRSAELAADNGDYYAVCHTAGVVQEHRFLNLWRFQYEHFPSEVPTIELAPTWGNCHVSVPVELVIRLFGRRGWGHADPATAAELGAEELAEWADWKRSGDEGFQHLEILGAASAPRRLWA